MDYNLYTIPQCYSRDNLIAASLVVLIWPYHLSPLQTLWKGGKILIMLQLFLLKLIYFCLDTLKLGLYDPQTRLIPTTQLGLYRWVII
jgi:hypothetical protein